MPEANEKPRPSTSVDRLLESYTKAEEKLVKVQRKKLIFIIIALALGSIFLGILLGVLIFQPVEDNIVTTTEDKVVSHTGIIRSLNVEQNGASYYLEQDNGTRVLLTSSQFDFSFFVGVAVTVEGISTGFAGDGSEIVSVNKIRFK